MTKGRPYYLDWDPDGSRLAIHVDTTFLGFVDLEGNRTALETVPGLFQAPQFLDDGRLLVATGGEEQGVAVSAAGSGDTATIAPTTGGTFFSASADGALLAFTDTADAPILGSLATAGTRHGVQADRPTPTSSYHSSARVWLFSGGRSMISEISNLVSGFSVRTTRVGTIFSSLGGLPAWVAR